ncbi:hypothetical protein SASPL_141038 [Salvia splendens]|uniref:beta-galactosidase n=1 Tax=Salvia splendens TaxID=180675 RepID=A0A8X8ZCF1_SALSN|nr:hypothetical protein SASPL_141038 [Salvia splendens]
MGREEFSFLVLSIIPEALLSGFPVWLEYVPGISFRTDNEPLKMAMKGLTEKIVDMMKARDLYESQGGPIIVSQIENEYGPQAKQLGLNQLSDALWYTTSFCTASMLSRQSPFFTVESSRLLSFSQLVSHSACFREWRAWEKANCGSMARASEDTGQNTLLVTAMDVVTRGSISLQSGKPTQRWYHLPRSWLKPTRNLLVLFEELGGDPKGITLVKRSVTTVCADATEYHPNSKRWQTESNGRTQVFHQPKIHLHCGLWQSISSIKFASFGTPLGTCGSFQQGTCHAPTSYDILKKKCIGKQKCSVTVSNSNFVKDPCPNVSKRLSVEAICAPQK